MMNTAIIWGANGGIRRAPTTELASKDRKAITITRDAVVDPKAMVTIQADATKHDPVNEPLLSATHE
jgi:hypothetical protein